MTLSIALRGDTARFPGNTLPALRSASRAGADLVKIDVHLTADGYLVLIDERTVAAPGSPPRPVGELSLAELAAAREDVERRVPTLMEVLAEFEGGGPPPLLVDAGAPETALAADTLLRGRGFGDQVLFTGSTEALGALRARSPDARLMLAWDQPGLPPEDVTRSLRPNFLGAHHTLLTRELVEEIHRSGRRVTAWTVNDFPEMARLMGIGVDALATERVEDLVSLTTGRARGEPAPDPV
ncbi:MULTISPECIES: glycerophosphodiester phosphodiesterase [Nocardiopsis]|uniref:Glycerophosphodiester phosphodiesterase n=1 Tax=Nocardiopsis sinuspersici TaxID=501010 RepID=A0A1V3BWU0_9ACTN|nr:MULTISPECIES: glycerophosphodiester phosphodiesterase [Nocardiopsis]NYH54246.1 glycerophosphoryl diester phosphodiesterase [Nocardiopsis sinuspersici]OOC53064.1 glycerophosphodiester phosphodiesterase [Nocardiopsis sinuspersici]